MPYVVMFAAFAAWTFFALRGQSVRHYAPLYWFSGWVAWGAEFFFGEYLNLYNLYVHMLPTPWNDDLLTATLDTAFLIPLIGVLYARYCKQRPVVAAAVASVLLGLIEVALIYIFAMVTFGWSSVFSVFLFFGYFLLLWPFATRKWRIPDWLHLYTVAFEAAYLPDILVHGAFDLWHYVPLPITGRDLIDNRILALLICGAVIAPFVTWMTFIMSRRGKAWILIPGGVLLFVGMNEVLLRTGWLAYGPHWNHLFAAGRFLFAVGFPLIYWRWYKSGNQKSAETAPA